MYLLTTKHMASAVVRSRLVASRVFYVSKNTQQFLTLDRIGWVIAARHRVNTHDKRVGDVIRQKTTLRRIYVPIADRPHSRNGDANSLSARHGHLTS